MRPTRLAVAAEARQVRSFFEPLGGASAVASRALRLLSMLLAVGLWIASADAALAGPTTTTEFGATTTTSTTGPPTTTTTTTTTTGPPTTTTTATTAPPTTSTTTTTSSTTTTTLVGLSGNYSFTDRSGDPNTSFLSIDTPQGLMCVAGQVVEFDRLALPFNRSVTLSYESDGTVFKETDETVVGEFQTTVLVSLVIVNEVSEAQGGPLTEYEGQATAENCVLEARLLKSGERDKVKLRCDLGEDLEEFSPELTDDQIENVHNAYRRGKRARVDTKSGKLKIRHHGDPADSVPIACSLPSEG